MHAERLAALACLLLGGCNLILGIPEGSLAGPDGMTADAPPGVVRDAGGPIEGTSTTTYLQMSDLATATAEEVPDDLTQVAIAALVPAGNGFASYPASTTTDGHFRIVDAPLVDHYYLRVASTGAPPIYYDVDARVLELGSQVPGRRGRTTGGAGTFFAVDVTGLNPVFADDGAHAIEAWIPNMNLRRFMFSPADGASSIMVAADWVGEPLVRGSLGDRAFLAYREQTAVVQLASLASFDLVDGMVVTATGSFTTITRNKTLNVTAKLPAFLALVPAEAISSSINWGLFVSPPELLGVLPFESMPFYWEQTATLTGQVTGSRAYGNPQGAAETLVTRLQFVRRYQLPGTSPINLSVQDETITPVADPAVFEPLVGPPQNLRLADVAIAGDASVPFAAGIGPTLSWEAPSVGVAHYYEVMLVNLRNVAATTRQTSVASFVTPRTSIIIPRELLAVGERYYVRIAAAHDTRSLAAPNRHSVPHGESTALSGIISLTTP